MRIRLRSPRVLSVLIIVLGIGVLLLHKFGVLTPLERALTRVATPILSILSRSANATARVLGIATGEGALRQENQDLRGRLNALLIEREQWRMNVSDGAKVEAAIRYLNERQWPGTLVRVIGRSPDPTFRLYIVNRGTRDGIIPGAAAMVGNGILVGKVLEADVSTAKILLVTDPHARTAGLIDTTARTQGLLTGEHGLSLRMDLLSKDELVTVGDTVLTSGVDPGVPAGLVVGRVASVENHPGDLFQSATIEPADPLRDLTVMTILSLTHA